MVETWIIQDLMKSGLTIDDFPVIPLVSDEQLSNYLGFTSIGDAKIIDVGGYFIAYANVDHYHRLKLKEEVGDCKYLSPSKEIGNGNHPFILLSVLKVAKDFNPDKPLIFTEGEKKAACGVKHGFNVIGISGVWCFKDNENDFLSEFDELNFKFRKCFICFDSDITEKHHVRHAELRLAVELINRGGIPISLRLPNESDSSKNGLDDFLIRYGKEKFEELLNKAEEGI